MHARLFSTIGEDHYHHHHHYIAIETSLTIKSSHLR
jgi:hypothetical protein